jgi:hypothetical protein
MGSKSPEKTREYVPGPGAYELDGSNPVQRSAPAYTLSGRTEQKPSTQTPGPGAYTSDKPTNSMSFSMSGRPEYKDHSFTPGNSSILHA